jgi:hypothetical protein
MGFHTYPSITTQCLGKHSEILLNGVLSVSVSIRIMIYFFDFKTTVNTEFHMRLMVASFNPSSG